MHNIYNYSFRLHIILNKYINNTLPTHLEYMMSNGFTTNTNYIPTQYTYYPRAIE